MTNPRSTSRRLIWALLLTSAIALLALLLAGYRLQVDRSGGDRQHGSLVDLGAKGALAILETVAGAKASNVILIIGDGLGQSQVAAGRAALAGASGRLFFEHMPTATFVTTHSLTGLITDSAAAATALATASKTVNGALSQCANGRSLPTIVELARQQFDLAVGLVTTSYLTDATPAAFVTHVASRKEDEAIAAQMAASGTDVLFGEESKALGGRDGGDRGLDDFAAAGFHVARTSAALAASPADGRLLGLFPPDTIGNPAVAPTLPELARFALDRLAASGRRFFLLVESEETDTASHKHDFPRLLDGIESLDAVSRLAVEHAQRDGRTLVLLTGDHDTGALAVVSGEVGEPFGIRWGTTSHSFSPVPLYAYGPGAAALAQARDNVDIPRIVGALLGLELPATSCD